MRYTRGAALLAAGVMAFGLTGCGENDEPEGSPSTATPHTPPGGGKSTSGSSTSGSSGSSSGSSSSTSGSGGESEGESETATGDLPEDMPGAAKERTKEGAAAFGEYYLEVYGESAASGEVTTLESLSTNACKACQAGLEQITTDAEKGWKRSDNPYSAASVTAAKRPDDGYKVSMEVSVHEHERLDEEGKTNGNIPATSFTLTQQVIWKSGQWHMNAWVAT